MQLYKCFKVFCVVYYCSARSLNGTPPPPLPPHSLRFSIVYVIVSFLTLLKMAPGKVLYVDHLRYTIGNKRKPILIKTIIDNHMFIRLGHT